MKSARTLPAVLLLSSLTALTVAAECKKPPLPQIPDGAQASEDRMLAVQSEVADFIAEGRQYLNCIKNEEAALATNASDDERRSIVNRYNAMIDNMKTTSTRFNKAVNDYQKTLEEEAE